MLKGIILLLMFSVNISSSTLMDPTSLSKDLYEGVILEGTYSNKIDKPSVYLGFEIGERVASPYQISNAIIAWANQSDRMIVKEYARSHEDRPLYAVFISSPENLNNLDTIKENLNLLSDGINTNANKARLLIEELPAIAWMAYSIHGNETSGADAAMASIYHFIASEDKDTLEMLDNMVIIIDPMMNPDGRARFAKSLEQYRGTAPNYDDQSLLHTGDWPYGRTNHYFFDLNRDWIYVTQPETRGRVKLINEWKPQILVDAHEMGPQDTFMTGPPREPINKNIDKDLIKWGNIFAQDQGNAFDDRDWRFYTGEWHEDLYPGYSFYIQFRGTLGILYEQSRMAEDGVKRPEGTIQSYKESVHHQYVSTMVNLKTLLKNSKAMYRDYWEGRKYNISRDSKYANQTFVVLPTKNIGRLETLIEKLRFQDIELYKNEKPILVENILKQSGDIVENFTIPIGSLIIPNRQPEAPILAAMMEFDAEIDEAVLLEERQSNLRDGSSIMYDTTAFNLSMMYGLPAITVPENINSNLIKWESEPIRYEINSDALMWSVDGNDDRSVAFAARLMELGIQVRVIDKETLLSGHKLSRGSVVVIAMDNPLINSLYKIIEEIAYNLDISVVSIESGFGPEELPDWGGEHFDLLERPQIAILSHEGFNSYDVGVSLWSIDHHLGIRHSQINKSIINYADLDRYNTIVIPSGSSLSETNIDTLSNWVENGGTLVAHNRSTRSLASDKGIGNVKLIQHTFDNSQDFNIDLQREIYSLNDEIDYEKTLSNKVDSDISYPWESEGNTLSKEDLESRDKWQSLFMPSGSIVSARTDQKHWLTFGSTKLIPVLYGDSPVLMTGRNAQAAVRIGEIIDSIDNNDVNKINWSTIPPGKDINVRMSGLVWPEAAQRIANSAYLTRERFGEGQIILFSGEPNFRGSSLGTNRLWLNAIVYGAGLGTSQKVSLN
ncbi:MAG: M14 family metallopeptidase [Gammaproteobacteria bacterium]